jgi:hypothetical protein
MGSSKEWLLLINMVTSMPGKVVGYSSFYSRANPSSSAESPTGETRLSFVVNDGLNLPAALLAVTDKPVNLSYTGTARLTTPSPSQSVPPPAATTKSGATALSSQRLIPGLIGVCGLSTLLILLFT